MSLVNETDEEIMEIWANAPIAKDTFQVISLHASWFSKKYYLQNMDTESITVTLEDDVTEVEAEYAPMSVTESGNSSDMSFTRDITIEALNDKISEEMENRDYTSDEDVIVEARTYVVYRDGTISEMKGSVSTTVLTLITRAETGSTLSSSTKSVTSQSTGERATISRVPMIKGFI